MNQDHDILAKSSNKTITDIHEDDAIFITFDDGSRIKISDQGQSCCESRYMTTDDDLSYYIGSQFIGHRIEDGPDVYNNSYCCHETQFLMVDTSKGTFTCVTHNEHNGYYGGFSVMVQEI